MEIVEVTSRKHLRDFIQLPFTLHKDHKKWVPPLLMDERLFFNKKKNLSFKKNEAILFIAYEGDEPLGRVMGIINPSYNKLRNEKNVRFGYLECYEDMLLASALMKQVEDWGKNKGMKKIVGPLGFSDQDPEGFLIEGYNYEPTLSTYYNFDYIPKILDKLRYTKEIDYVVYLVDLTIPISELHDRVFKRITSRKEIKFLEFNSKKELKPYVKPIIRVMNESFTELYGFEPLNENEIDFLIKRFLPIINPSFIKAASRNGKLVGFLLAIPNINEGLRKCKGRLFPLGVFHLINSSKKAKQLDLLAGGVVKEFRGQGFETWGLISAINSAKQAGYFIMDSHHELEENIGVRKVMERLGGRLAKRFRVFQKMISD